MQKPTERLRIKLFRDVLVEIPAVPAVPPSEGTGWGKELPPKIVRQRYKKGSAIDVYRDGEDLVEAVFSMRLRNLKEGVDYLIVPRS